MSCRQTALSPPHSQRTYAGFVESVRKQTHMLKKKEDEVKRLRSGLIEKERFLMEQDKVSPPCTVHLLLLPCTVCHTGLAAMQCREAQIY